MTSIGRTIRHARKAGFKEWFRMQYIGDAKNGKLIGKDQFGNRYFENYNPREELPGRQRWVDYAQDDFNASQVPREWASWLNNIRYLPPDQDPVVIKAKQPWMGEYRENLTGTRGHFTTYDTTAKKTQAWEPKVKPRGGA